MASQASSLRAGGETASITTIASATSVTTVSGALANRSLRDIGGVMPVENLCFKPTKKSAKKQKPRPSAVHAYSRKKRTWVAQKIGSSTGTLNLTTYPKKLGISTPACWAIDFTMKFGPFPM